MQECDVQEDTMLVKIPKRAGVDLSKEGTRIDAYMSGTNFPQYSVIFYELENEIYMRNNLSIKPEKTWEVHGIPFHETENKFRQRSHDVERKYRIDDETYILDVFDPRHKNQINQIAEDLVKELDFQ